MLYQLCPFLKSIYLTTHFFQYFIIIFSLDFTNIHYYLSFLGEHSKIKIYKANFCFTTDLLFGALFYLVYLKFIW